MKVACRILVWSVLAGLTACSHKNTLFEALPSSSTGIRFANTITENDSINPIDLTNIYNGGGVGIGDFNNDGLPDIYFTGNRVASRLYLNRGHLKFDDITLAAGVDGEGKWCRGVAVVDINNDGRPDMYVCATMDPNPEKRRNILYVNQGNDKNGIPVFKDMAKAYGLDDTTHSTMAAFFDYDNDGDLDVYIAVNQIIPSINPATFRPKITDGSFPSTGRLYRNDWNAGLKHGVFTDVSKLAGVTTEGYGHGVSIADFNKDGWKDIFVTNDFISNDLLYINNHDGTFSNKADSYFKHTSANGMGQDVIDINNDGLSDVVELDMNPADNYRKKMMLSSSGYQTFQNSDYFHYQYQYARNSLQVNQGPRINGNDSVGDPVFSDAGYLAGISETDWSWCPLVADFDNDGLRDIIVTNGYPKDITDHDFITFRQQASTIASKSFTLKQVPQVKLHKYAFHNNGNLSFSDVSANWGFTATSFSNGAAYADLDNDGDLDVIINNINDEAAVYENHRRDDNPASNHYLNVVLKGDALNRNGLGAWLELFYDHRQQAYEQTPYRGYLSTMPIDPHFGLDTLSRIDSIIVKWPNGKRQLLKNVPTDQSLVLDIKNAREPFSWNRPATDSTAVFTDITAAAGLNFSYQQKDFVDFNIQKLLPHKFSEYGPSLAVGDINGDGLDDIISGGNSANGITALTQQSNGGFSQQTLFAPPPANYLIAYQDMGLMLFDADGDGRPDLYVSHGGYESKPGSPSYQDRFYHNDGNGKFTYDSLAIPANLVSKSCVRAIDYDRDGDLDLFIAGRVDPWHYPRPVSSFIYRNDSKDGKVKFTNVTAEAAAGLKNVGMVCDAVFTDFNNDGWPDLVLAGEWMPVTFFKNDKGVFRDVTAASGIGREIGWWNSIAAGDFDNDGDIDYIFGNLGENSFYKATDQYPVTIYAKDFDNNGSYDAFPSLYLPTSQEDTVKREYPAQNRDDAIKQMLGIRSIFQNYKSYATATMDKLFSKAQLQEALIIKANNLRSSYCRNDGHGKFTLLDLPVQAQLSAINGMVADDFDGDGNLDLLINTNDYGTDVNVGRYDAGNGLMLKGDGKGGFSPLSMLQSGVYIPGNGKAMVSLRGKTGQYLVAAGQNRAPLKLLQLKQSLKPIPVFPGDESAVLVYKNGKTRKQELYYGHGFLSQSARCIWVNDRVKQLTISDSKGKSRVIPL